jgi:spectinomycin phosphotransferase
MRAKPSDVDEGLLSDAIRKQWGFRANTLKFEPLGAGSHHWFASDAAGERRFVTVDDLGLKPWFGADTDAAFRGLKTAYEVARMLHDGGLDFVVAPIPAARDEVLVWLSERFTIALFPFVDGHTADFDDAPVGRERDALLRMWARLHAATPLVRGRALKRGFGVTCRRELEAALRETDRAWEGGPHSEAAREWVASNRDWLIGALARFDDSARRIAVKGYPPVITHGEPHGRNLITNGSSRFLIDWDTVALALPERDLWMLDDGAPGALDAYAEASGRAADPECVAFYAATWHLSDIALFVDLLRDPHIDDADTRAALANLDVAAARLSPYIPTHPS